MKTKIKIEKEVNVKYLQIVAKVRYWEDATIDGIEAEDAQGVPCGHGEFWEPLIDIDLGVILNWEQGKTADMHFKICDEGDYILMDEDKEELLSIIGDYVPNKLVPGKYGDYIIMTIDEAGKIAEWPKRIDISEFIDQED